MSSIKNRQKHMLSRSWFKIDVKGAKRVVRPVDGEQWFGGASMSTGVVYLIDENNDLVDVIEISTFNKNAKCV